MGAGVSLPIFEEGAAFGGLPNDVMLHILTMLRDDVAARCLLSHMDGYASMLVDDAAADLYREGQSVSAMAAQYVTWNFSEEKQEEFGYACVTLFCRTGLRATLQLLATSKVLWTTLGDHVASARADYADRLHAELIFYGMVPEEIARGRAVRGLALRNSRYMRLGLVRSLLRLSTKIHGLWIYPPGGAGMLSLTRDRGMDATGVRALMEAVASNTSLQRLWLHGVGSAQCRVGFRDSVPSVSVAIADAVAANRSIALVHIQEFLNLNLAAFGSLTQSTTRRLELCDTYFEAADLHRFATALCCQPLPMHEYVPMHVQISDCFLTYTGMRLLARAISGGAIGSLEIDHNRHPMCLAFMKLIKTAAAARTSRLCKFAISRCCISESVDGESILSVCAQMAPCLTSLCLNERFAGPWFKCDAAMSCFKDALVDSDCTMDTLSLSHMLFGDEGVQHLATGLTHNRSITQLTLHNTRCTDIGAHALAEAISTNRSLKKLVAGDEFSSCALLTEACGARGVDAWFL